MATVKQKKLASYQAINLLMSLRLKRDQFMNATGTPQQRTLKLIELDEVHFDFKQFMRDNRSSFDLAILNKCSGMFYGSL